MTNNLILNQSTITKKCKQTCKQQDEFPHYKLQSFYNSCQVNKMLNLRDRKGDLKYQQVLATIK